MVKLKIALEGLSKTQLLDIAKQCGNVPTSASRSKPEIITCLNDALPATPRLVRLMEAFDTKDKEVIKMFLAEKSLRYSGMSQAEFAKFLTQNLRMANSFSSTINKLRALGLIFVNVTVHDKNKVVFPSEYLRFFDDYFKNGTH